MREALARLLRKDKEAMVTTSRDGGKPYVAMLVAEDDLVEYVEMGWEIVKELSSGQIAIRKTTEQCLHALPFKIS